jgi:hypothetical protein
MTGLENSRTEGVDVRHRLRAAALVQFGLVVAALATCLPHCRSVREALFLLPPCANGGIRCALIEWTAANYRVPRWASRLWGLQRELELLRVALVAGERDLPRLAAGLKLLLLDCGFGSGSRVSNWSERRSSWRSMAYFHFLHRLYLALICGASLTSALALVAERRGVPWPRLQRTIGGVQNGNLNLPEVLLSWRIELLCSRAIACDDYDARHVPPETIAEPVFIVAAPNYADQRALARRIAGATRRLQQHRISTHRRHAGTASN